MTRQSDSRSSPGVPQPATVELLTLAAKARPDWAPDQMRDALARARTAGWSWGQVLIATARLIADPAGDPTDLAAQVRTPSRWSRTQQQIETTHRGAAAVRAALHPTHTD